MALLFETIILPFHYPVTSVTQTVRGFVPVPLPDAVERGPALILDWLNLFTFQFFLNLQKKTIIRKPRE